MPAADFTPVPAREPDVIRRFACNNVDGDVKTRNNKYWQFRYWTAERFLECSWGGIPEDGDYTPAPARRQTFQNESISVGESKAFDKMNARDVTKRYTEVPLQSKAVAPAGVKVQVLVDAADQPGAAKPVAQLPAPALAIDPAVMELVKMLHSVANDSVQKNFKVSVGGNSHDALGIEAVKEGRILIAKARDSWANATIRRDVSALSRIVMDYATITLLSIPRGFGKEDIIEWFYADLYTQEDRLNQLEAALASLKYTQATAAAPADPKVYSPVYRQYESMGIEICPMDTRDPRFIELTKMFDETITAKDGKRDARIKQMFTVVIPRERAAFNAWYGGFVDRAGDPLKANVQTMYHGTARASARHILNHTNTYAPNGGIGIPTVAANGSRFGRGCYFAPRAERSLRYTDFNHEGSRPPHPYVMFFTSVGLGKEKNFGNTEAPHLTAAPSGFDSVTSPISLGGRGGESIVYDPRQQTIRTLALVEPLRGNH